MLEFVLVIFCLLAILRDGGGSTLSCYFGTIPYGADPGNTLTEDPHCDLRNFDPDKYNGKTCVITSCFHTCYSITRVGEYTCTGGGGIFFTHLKSQTG